MNECKHKHLEFIQNVIIRMNSNSFIIKGWAITIITALFALAASGVNSDFVIVSLFVLLVFWILDGFFISQERQYRELYNEVSKTDNTEINYSMNTSQYNNSNRTWFLGMFSKTLVTFYGFAAAVILIALFYFDY